METMGFVYMQKHHLWQGNCQSKHCVLQLLFFSVFADAKKQKKDGKKRDRTQMD